MSYQALYRKYRPKDLNEVYGQNIAVNILKNAVQNKKFGHAYLFTGSRGCGKTSVAKIFARMVNCNNIINGIPCGKCEYCKNALSNNCVDILEIDAASNNGVDEIRELKSKVNLIPAVLKYKVYIIDEVHMLSIGAFNALLKTLEEPPEHVIFILATTELQKVPITIISRCQTIEFKKINKNAMFERLKEICEKESIKITDDAIYEIINASDGGLRDAIGLLDMANTYTNDEITEEDILTINGNVSNNDIDNIINLIINKETNQIIKVINNYYDDGKDLIKIVEKIIIKLKDKMILENNTNICLIIEELSNAVDKMNESLVGKIYLEIAIFKICNKENNNHDNIEITKPKNNELNFKEQNNTKIENQINEDKEQNNKKTENQVNKDEEQNIKINYQENELPKINNNFKNIRINNTFAEANKKTLLDIKNKWNKLNDYTFNKEYGAIVCELIDAIPLVASSKYLILGYKYTSFVEKGNSNIVKYEQVLNKTIGIDTKLIFLTNEEWEKIKKEYIENIKNNVQYNYIEEKEIENLDNQNTNTSSVNIKNSDILEKANELFDMSKIEIKERL